MSCVSTLKVIGSPDLTNRRRKAKGRRAAVQSPLQSSQTIREFLQNKIQEVALSRFLERRIGPGEFTQPRSHYFAGHLTSPGLERESLFSFLCPVPCNCVHKEMKAPPGRGQVPSFLISCDRRRECRRQVSSPFINPNTQLAFGKD